MNSKCSICLKSFRKYWTSTIPCKHSAHSKCLKNFLNSIKDRKPNCFICRTEIFGYKLYKKNEFKSHHSINAKNKYSNIIKCPIIEMIPETAKENEKLQKEDDVEQPILSKNQRRQRRRRQKKRYFKSIGRNQPKKTIIHNPFLKMI